jgi:hypothetical protein
MPRMTVRFAQTQSRNEIMAKTSNSNSSIARWSGELERAETHTAARIQFLCAIQRNHPKVLRELHQMAMPHFLGLLRTAKISVTGFYENGDSVLQNRIWRALICTVFQWARRFHLVAGEGPLHPPILEPAYHRAFWNQGRSLLDWLVQVCADSLGTWKATKQKGKALAWDFGPIQQRLRLPAGDEFRFVAAPWVPHRETLKAFHERVEHEFQQALETYTAPIISSLTATTTLPLPSNSESVDRILTAMLQTRHAAKDENPAIKPDPTIIPPMASKLSTAFTPDHYIWLVQYQVMRWSWSKIVGLCPREITQAAVKFGVKKAAADVIGEEWSKWLRAGKPGRPRKR